MIGRIRTGVLVSILAGVLAIGSVAPVVAVGDVPRDRYRLADEKTVKAVKRITRIGQLVPLEQSKISVFFHNSKVIKGSIAVVRFEGSHCHPDRCLTAFFINGITERGLAGIALLPVKTEIGHVYGRPCDACDAGGTIWFHTSKGKIRIVWYSASGIVFM